MKPDLALRRRMFVNVVMVPGLIIMTMLGGWPFTVFVTLALVVAARELWLMFQKGGHSPSLTVMGIFIAASVIMRHLFQFEYSGVWLTALILVAMFVHILAMQKGVKTAATDFILTVGSVLYLGWLGSYTISLRWLENGLYWVLLVFPIISLADSGAYIFGRLFGKHKMIPLVSPKKSWEGYIGGIFIGTLGGWALAALWHLVAASILPYHGLIIGAVISILAPFGDFGESMIKRQFDVKDSSNLLLEHGGILDRMDSSLWAAAIGFYLVQLLL